MFEKEIQLYVEFIKSKAYSRYVLGKCGYCARACREALEYGLKKNLERQEHAKQYGDSLMKIGFKKIFTGLDLNDLQCQMGDVAVLKYEPSGHMCIYDGAIWYSDFKQIDVYGGKIRLIKPEITIYRYKV